MCKFAFNLEFGHTVLQKHIHSSRESFPLPICLKLSRKYYMKYYIYVTEGISPSGYFLNNPRKITQMKLAFNLELGKFYKKHIRSRESLPLPNCLKLSPQNHMEFTEGIFPPRYFLNTNSRKISQMRVIFPPSPCFAETDFQRNYEIGDHPLIYDFMTSIHHALLIQYRYSYTCILFLSIRTAGERGKSH